MSKNGDTTIRIEGVLTFAAHRQVFLGSAPANLLARLSFADILNEETGKGYQRRFNRNHSLDFCKYIQQPNSTTIPLTLNLRPGTQGWQLVKSAGSFACLEITPSAGKIMAQVDCQHRLGFLTEVTLPLPFMCYLGLTEREEMETFSIINSKAKGLNASLLDYHDAALAQDLAKDRPELFIAHYLNANPDSAWYRQLSLGGTSGYGRRASLRTMQQGVKRFLSRTKIVSTLGIETSTAVVRDFWSGIALVLEDAWKAPRKHFLTKGIGVYALMDLAADLFAEQHAPHACDTRFFSAKLAEFITDFNWSTKGPLKGLGGEAGASAVLEQLRQLRTKKHLRVVGRG